MRPTGHSSGWNDRSRIRIWKRSGFHDARLGFEHAAAGIQFVAETSPLLDLPATALRFAFGRCFWPRQILLGNRWLPAGVARRGPRQHTPLAPRSPAAFIS